MIVVADASPINYLIQLECVEILEQFYGRVLVPQAVMRELRDERAPASVNRWSSTLPSWAEVGHLAASQDDSLRDFGAGEGEAILLALQKHADCCSLMRDKENSRQSAGVSRLPERWACSSPLERWDCWAHERCLAGSLRRRIFEYLPK
jgi:predicted nucleic acid-binding protein